MSRPLPLLQPAGALVMLAVDATVKDGVSRGPGDPAAHEGDPTRQPVIGPVNRPAAATPADVLLAVPAPSGRRSRHRSASAPGPGGAPSVPQASCAARFHRYAFRARTRLYRHRPAKAPGQ